MLSSSAFTALVDIPFNIVLIGDFVGGITLETFEPDLKMLYATTRALEIISEANRRLPTDLKDRYPEILWKEIRDAGNSYRHAYDDVEASIIWRTAVDSLPSLLAIVEAELATANGDMDHPKDTL